MSAVSLCGNPEFLLTINSMRFFFPIFLQICAKICEHWGCKWKPLGFHSLCACVCVCASYSLAAGFFGFFVFLYMLEKLLPFFFFLVLNFSLHSWLRDKMEVSGVLQCWSLPLQRWPRKHSDSQMADCWVGHISGCPSVPRVLLEEACWLLWLLHKPWYCIPIYSLCLSP